MKWFKSLKILAPILLVASISVVAAIAALDAATVKHYKLYEIFGAVLASVITVFGIINMKRITEE